MDFSFSPDDQRLIDRAKALAVECSARAREYDDAAAFPVEDISRLREEGFLKLSVPEELGGHGMWGGRRYSVYYEIIAALAAGNSSTAQLLQIQTHASGIVAGLGNEEQKRRILGDVVANGALIASCGSEINPHQMSLANARTEMEAEEGGFRINTVKYFGSLSAAADYFVVYLKAPGSKGSSDGLTTVIVPKDAPGVSLKDDWDVMGMRATVSWSLVLDNVFIPWENVLGEPGDWVQHDPRTFTLANVANHIGAAQGVFDFITDYLQQRSFLVKDDSITSTVGKMDAGLQAARASMRYAAWLWEQNDFDEAEKAGMRALAMAKQVALMVTSDAFEVIGARAVFRNLPVERAFRDVRSFTIHTRESVFMRLLVEADLGGDFHSKQRYGAKIGRQSWEQLGLSTPTPA